MNKVSEILLNILKVVIICFIGFLLISSIDYSINLIKYNFSNIFLGIELIGITLGVLTILLKIDYKYKIVMLLILAALIRIFWICSVNTMPISDFNTMYESAIELLKGDFTSLHGYNYLARFPHLVPMTLYMTLMLKIFSSNAIIAMKIMNVILGVVSVYLIYKLSGNFVKTERGKLSTMLVGVIFPAFVSYTSVLCTENIAIPLYLLSMILFYKAEKSDNKVKIFFFTGMMLAIGNLFRGIAIVVLIAFTIYCVLCLSDKKIHSIISFISGYVLVTVIVSGVLLGMQVIENSLWKGKEPSSATLLLKGSNFESNGMWNLEDAKFVEDNLKNENLSKLCLEKVKNRVLSKKPSEILRFYFNKIDTQWKMGDCGGYYWAFLGAGIEASSPIPVDFEIIFALLLLLGLIGLIKQDTKTMSLLNITLIGFVLLFDIIETQVRYSYIVSWILVIFAGVGIEEIMNMFSKNKSTKFLPIKDNIKK